MAQIEGNHEAAGLSLAIVVARFNAWVTEALLEGAVSALKEMGADLEQVPVVKVPGSMELAVVAKKLAARHDAVICLGAVIKGQTDHYESVVDGTRQGIVQASVDTGKPIVFGVLTVRDREHARDRSGPEHNAGAEAARTAVEMAHVIRKLS